MLRVFHRREKTESGYWPVCDCAVCQPGMSLTICPSKIIVPSRNKHPRAKFKKNKN